MLCAKARTAGGLCDDCSGVVGAGWKGRSPQAWARGVPWGGEDWGAIGVVDCDGVLGDCGGAVGVAEAGETKEIVGETGDDVASACGRWYGWEIDRGRSRGDHGLAGCRLDCGRWAVLVDVVERGGRDEVVVRGPRVDDSCMRRRRRKGWAAGGECKSIG